MAQKNPDGRTVKVIETGGTLEPIKGIYSDRFAVSVTTRAGTNVETAKSLTKQLLALTAVSLTSEIHRQINETISDLNRLSQAQGRAKVGSKTLRTSSVLQGTHVPKRAAEAYVASP